MAKPTPDAVPPGNAVLETYIGKTRCIICDDFCPASDETRKRTGQSKINIGRIWYESGTAGLPNKSGK